MAEKTQSSKAMHALVLGLVTLVIVVLIGVGLYTKNGVNNLSESDTILSLASTFGTPAVTVNGEKILYVDYIADKQILTNLYADTPGAPPTTDEQVSDQVLTRLVANTLFAQIAEELDVAVTDERLEEEREVLLSQFPDEAALEEEIMGTYGWDVDTYLERVVSPALLQQALSEAYIENNVNNETVREEAQAVLDRILAGEAFEPLAAEFGSDGTALQGGDLGYFGRGVMVPAFEEAAFALDASTTAPTLVETDFGYHILRVEDKRTTTTPSGEEVEEVRARHILFQIGGGDEFTEFMNEKFLESDIDLKVEALHNPFVQIKEDLRTILGVEVPADDADAMEADHDDAMEGDAMEDEA